MSKLKEFFQENPKFLTASVFNIWKIFLLDNYNYHLMITLPLGKPTSESS
jgi:hypothetical protein